MQSRLVNAGKRLAPIGTNLSGKWVSTVRPVIATGASSLLYQRRDITTQVHKKADLAKLPELVKRFAEAYSKDRHALNDVESALNAIGNDDSSDMVQELEKRPFYDFLCDIKKNPANRSLVEMAVNTVKISDKMWWDQRRLFANDVVSEVMTKFGLGNRLNLNPGAKEERGQFFGYENGKPYILLQKQISDAKVIVFDGIDQSGIKTTSRIIAPISSITAPDGIAAYHYRASPSERGTALAATLQNRNTHSPGQERIAKVLLDARAGKHGVPDLNFAAIRYSYGTFHGWGMEHAIYEMLTSPEGRYKYTPEEASELLGDIRTINIGVQPFWNAKENWAATTKKSINIWAADDVFGPHSHWTRNLHRQAAALDPSERKACTAYVNPDNPNQVFLFLAAGITPSVMSSSGGRAVVNVGGHGFSHYLAPFGLIEGVEIEDESMRKAGEIMADFINGKQRDGALADQLREAGITVQTLDKAALKALPMNGSQMTDDLVMINYAKRLADETVGYGGTHPTVSAVTKRLSSNIIHGYG